MARLERGGVQSLFPLEGCDSHIPQLKPVYLDPACLFSMPRAFSKLCRFLLFVLFPRPIIPTHTVVIFHC
jgi:hypothetical protein